MSGRQNGQSLHSVLIVDDAPANVRLLSQMLTREGYRVRAATSGERALAAISSDPPDLILVDVRMPGMDGYAVCRTLKADPETRDVPVIFISALQDLADKMPAFEVGGVDYVTKPFQPEEVLARVRTHLALRDLQAQLEDANRRLERELTLAGNVQANLLPKELPHLPGWGLAVALRPARQTSGDFYDFCQLPDGRLGIAIADVVDKGAAAALYMALSCTLLRTYAVDYPTEPAEVLAAVNGRLLMDIVSGDYVTLFYAVLDPCSGCVTYVNAGHHPPYVLRSGGDGVEALPKTGMPLGLLAGTSWSEVSVKLEPGDALLLYTDGVTDSQRSDGVFFGAARLRASIEGAPGLSARELIRGIESDLDAFLDGESQQDDIALVALTRDTEPR